MSLRNSSMMILSAMLLAACVSTPVANPVGAREPTSAEMNCEEVAEITDAYRMCGN